MRSSRSSNGNPVNAKGGVMRDAEPTRTRRARHGDRKRCSDPNGTGCYGFARRNNDKCHECGGGTRAEVKWHEDGTAERRQQIRISERVAGLLDGSIGIDELDDEELVRGYMRSKDGSFKGTNVKVVPKAIHDKMIRELFSRADDMLKASLLDSVVVISQIAADPKATPAERLKAAQWIYERVRGKVPTDVHISGEMKPYEELLDDVHRKGAEPGYIAEANNSEQVIVVEGEIIDNRF